MSAVNKSSDIILNVNLKSLKENYKLLTKLSKFSEIAACVKANAYGLGLIEISKFLISLRCKSFFVATIDEALLLRENFEKIDIYLLNGINNPELAIKTIKKNITVVVNNDYQLNILKKTSKLINSKIKCAFHIDTGMNRLGFSVFDIKKKFENINKYLEVKLVMSHMVMSEKKSMYNSKQLKSFEKIKEILINSDCQKFSISNSNAIFLGNKYHFDLIRAGGFLFGLDLNKKNKSRSVIELKAKIIQIRRLKAGEKIGYGATFTTKKESVIATISIGYADGLPRNYKGYAIYKNKKVKFVGRISMDLSCIDVTNVKKIKNNDWVEIFGKNLDISKFALECGTIPYEISCNIGDRVKRVYYNS